MKRIFAVAMVKNESDVIESFCRHALETCDGMMLCNDDSADETKEIVEKLIAEGLNIFLYNNPDTIGFHQDEVTNRLAKTAAGIHGADLIIPMDADEFLCRIDGGSTRERLEGLDGDKAYGLNWPVFLPSAAERENGVFLPSYFGEYIRQSKIHKLVVGATLLTDGGYWICKGNHLLQARPGGGFYETGLAEDLVLAHYPVRSAEQAMTKVISGWANTLSMPGRVQGDSWHWESMYNYIKRTGYLSHEHLEELARIYSFADEAAPPVSSFTLNADIRLRYTDYTKAQRNFLNIILSNYERIIKVLLENGAGYSAESVILAE